MVDRVLLRRLARIAEVEGAGDAEEGMLVTGPETEIRALIQLVRSLVAQGERDECLLDALLQGVEPGMIGTERFRQLHQQAQARAAFLREVPLLNSAEVSQALGSKARNRSAMASRLKRTGKLIAVSHGGVDWYPAAQIVDRGPSPAIPKIVAAFSGSSPWALALWLHAPSGWLGGQRPLDLLAKEPERVVRAARQANEALRF